MGAKSLLNVAAITGGRDVPSARFRVRQYINSLLEHGVHIREFNTLTSAYPPQKIWKRTPWGVMRITEMGLAVLQSRRYDVTLLQREMLSTLSTLEGWTGRPRVLDVDDSIHLYRNGSTAQNLASKCDRIICGNNFLAEIYRRWNNDVVVLPTGVDTKYFCPSLIKSSGEAVVIGWIGTSGNLPYLLKIEAALSEVLAKYPNVILHVVSDKRPNFLMIKPSRYKHILWSANREAIETQAFDIGLMPLEDSLWAQGKCSFKMLQYMSCGIPVVVSPVGMNADVLRLGDVGYGVLTNEEWVDALAVLIENETLRARLGVNGRQIILRDFSISSLAPRLADYLRGLDGKG